MTDFDNFDSRIMYEMEGWIQEGIDTDQFTRATEATVTTETNLKYDELLRANIINLDAFLHETWSERITNQIDLGDGKTFIGNFKETTLRLDLRSDEVVKAAEARAAEDNSKAAYVLGNWVYLAKKADHIPSAFTIETAFERVSQRPDQPDDATTEEYGGGKD